MLLYFVYIMKLIHIYMCVLAIIMRNNWGREMKRIITIACATFTNTRQRTIVQHDKSED